MTDGRGTASRLIHSLMSQPWQLRNALRRLPDKILGQAYAAAYEEKGEASLVRDNETTNPLEQFFRDHNSGPGIWKWQHYFEICHRHLGKFVGQEVHFDEVGVFSGGSLSMWKSYFGNQARIHGVDLDEATRMYATDNLRIHIGDQADRAFWAEFRREVPTLDVLVDDGGHTTQ